MASTASHSRSNAAERPSYAARKADERAARIERARQNLRTRRVSLAPPAEGSATNHANVKLALSLSVATVCHVGVAFAAFSSNAHVEPPRVTRVKVQVVAAPVEVTPEPPRPAPPPVEAVVEKPLPVRREKARPSAPETPAPTPAPSAPQPVAIVGLTLESTSGGGGGPVFAVGNTLAGSTERVAAAPRTVPRDAPLAPPVPKAALKNRAAQPRATAGVAVEPARRLSRVTPTYPPLLERQGIEADVTVRVELDEHGRITRVELVRGAAEPAFDAAALEAARREQFAPETHDGTPVTTSLTYSYRFRITP